MLHSRCSVPINCIFLTFHHENSVNDTKERRRSAKIMLSAKTPDVEQRGTSDGSCKSAYIGLPGLR